MHQAKKGNQWCFGMKAHIGVDADSGAVHTVVGTAANANDVTHAHKLLHGQGTDMFVDAGYQGVAGREDAQHIAARWHVAIRQGRHRALNKSTPIDQLLDELERVNARVHAKVGPPFRVFKRQFGYRKVCYRSLAKNTARLITLSALANLWLLRCKLLAL